MARNWVTVELTEAQAQALLNAVLFQTAVFEDGEDPARHGWDDAQVDALTDAERILLRTLRHLRYERARRIG